MSKPKTARAEKLKHFLLSSSAKKLLSYFGSYDIVNSSVKAPVFQQFHKPVLPQINLAKNYHDNASFMM